MRRRRGLEAGLIATAAALLLVTSATPEARALEGPSWEQCRTAGACTIPVIVFPRGPFAFVDGKNRWTGFEVQMMKLFAQRLEERGVEAEVDWHRVESFPEVLGTLGDSEGGVFAVSQISLGEERRESMAFSPPYMGNVAVLVTHESVPELESLDDAAEALGGMTALSIEGTTLETAIAELRRRYVPEAELLQVGSDQTALSRVAGEPGCCFTYMDFPQYGSAVRAGAPLRRHAVGDREGDRFAVAFPLGTDWQPVVDAFFDEFVGGEEYEFLLQHFLGWEQASVLRPADR